MDAFDDSQWTRFDYRRCGLFGLAWRAWLASRLWFQFVFRPSTIRGVGGVRKGAWVVWEVEDIAYWSFRSRPAAVDCTGYWIMGNWVPNTPSGSMIDSTQPTASAGTTSSANADGSRKVTSD
jgi:hypothetical protein